MAFVLVAKKRGFGLLFPRFFSSPSPSPSASQNPDIKSPPFRVADYLVSSFDISPAKAARISKPIAHLKSPQNPDAVRRFFQHHGFDDSEIKTIITCRPTILSSSPEKTLAPNLRALREMNLSTDALNQIILSDPEALQLSSAVHKINFWKDFVLGRETDLVKLFKRNRGLICHDTNGGIAAKFSLLQSNGISKRDIHWIVCTAHQFITTSVSLMEDLLKRTKELGFRPESKMFVHGLLAMRSATREAVQKKMELLKSVGWSEDEILSAAKKTPIMVALSEENLRAKMNFLLEEAKCDISYIALHPVLLTLSLKKRLRPRYNILCLLESKDLFAKRKDFYSTIIMSDNKFVAKYILPHKEKLPKLHDAYIASCA